MPICGKSQANFQKKNLIHKNDIDNRLYFDFFNFDLYNFNIY